VFFGAAAEAATITDSASAIKYITAQADETATVTDAATTNATLRSSVNESAQMADAAQAAQTLIARAQESVTITDAAIALLLWNVINDSQATTWNTITTTRFILVPDTGGGFSQGAFASGPFDGLGKNGVVVDTAGQYDLINTYEDNRDWATIATQTIASRPIVDSGFSSGGFSSGPFDALGVDSSVVQNTSTWQNITTSTPIDWQIVETL
jgi:hypothetical protein